MKKIWIIAILAVCISLLYGCMHNCTCITTNDITLPDRHVFYCDTLSIDSRDDCALMNFDTLYKVTITDSNGVIINSATYHTFTVCQ